MPATSTVGVELRWTIKRWRQATLVIAKGAITKADDELDFQGSDVRYACHLDCWDGIEEAIS